MACDLDVRAGLLANIVIVGGGSLIPGFVDRFNWEMARIAPNVRPTLLLPSTSPPVLLLYLARWRPSERATTQSLLLLASTLTFSLLSPVPPARLSPCFLDILSVYSKKSGSTLRVIRSNGGIRLGLVDPSSPPLARSINFGFLRRSTESMDPTSLPRDASERVVSAKRERIRERQHVLLFCLQLRRKEGWLEGLVGIYIIFYLHCRRLTFALDLSFESELDDGSMRPNELRCHDLRQLDYVLRSPLELTKPTRKRLGRSADERLRLEPGLLLASHLQFRH